MGQALNAQGQIVTFFDPTADQTAAASARRAARQLPRYLDLALAAKLTAGITVDGISIPTDDTSMTWFHRAYSAAQADVVSSFNWAMPDGSTQIITAAQMIAIGNAIAVHVEACFTALSTIKAAIAATPPTITTKAQIDAAFAGIT